MKTRTHTYFELVTGLLGESPNSYAPENFKNKTEAKEYWLREYRLRKEDDGHDAYWNAVPFRVQKIVKTVTQYW